MNSFILNIYLFHNGFNYFMVTVSAVPTWNNVVCRPLWTGQSQWAGPSSDGAAHCFGLKLILSKHSEDLNDLNDSECINIRNAFTLRFLRKCSTNYLHTDFMNCWLGMSIFAQSVNITSYKKRYFFWFEYALFPTFAVQTNAPNHNRCHAATSPKEHRIQCVKALKVPKWGVKQWTLHTLNKRHAGDAA